MKAPFPLWRQYYSSTKQLALMNLCKYQTKPSSIEATKLKCLLKNHAFHKPVLREFYYLFKTNTKETRIHLLKTR